MKLLQIEALDSFYVDFQALFGVNFAVDAGQIVALVGANGAGKTTLLRVIAGLQPASAQALRFVDRSMVGVPAHRAVRRGIALVPEGRRLFPSLTVEENLLMGAYAGRDGPWSLAAVYELFPVLKERRRTPGTRLSGGQQQMVAIGRGLMGNPDLLLCDEISLGLAPVIVKDIYAKLPEALTEGTAAVIVEQDIAQAMRVADYLYCLQEGRVSLSGAPADLTQSDLSAAYFGT